MNVLAPLGIIVNELPEQIAPLLTDTLGVAFTDTVAAAVFVQDVNVLVPVTT